MATTTPYPGSTTPPTPVRIVKQASTCTHLQLNTTIFEAAILHFLDESKPDPLANQQARKWILEWNNANSEDHDGICKETCSGTTTDELVHLTTSMPQHLISGTLTIRGDHVAVQIGAVCQWSSDEQETTNERTRKSPSTITNGNRPKQGKESFLYCKLTCQAYVRSKADLKKQNSKEEKTQDKKQARLEAKVRGGMVQRLRSDPYVRRLLLQDYTITSCSDQVIDGSVLCEALLYSSNNLVTQERVDVREEVLEGIKRAIFSQADGNLAMMECLLAMPYLPLAVFHKSTFFENKIQLPVPPRCLLADRAKLRLLEDAMVDACEKEGEDELLDSLAISDAQSSEDDDDDEIIELSNGKKGTNQKVLANKKNKTK